jgi:hypothetical protein
MVDHRFPGQRQILLGQLVVHPRAVTGGRYQSKIVWHSGAVFIDSCKTGILIARHEILNFLYVSRLLLRIISGQKHTISD